MRNRPWLATLPLAALALSTSFAGAEDAPPQLGESPIAEVIAALTTEEKAALAMGTGMNFPGASAERRGPAVGQTENRVPGAAGTTLAVPRLGIPATVLADGPAGLRIQPRREGDDSRTYFCTAYPIATLLASSWDTALVERVGKAVGHELKEYGVDVLLAPALNIHRYPLGGRNFEYYSEDPLVAGKMAAAMTRGVQSQGVGTSLKHFVANNHEWNRNTIDVIASERALREIYLRGFEIAVREASPWTIMTSYNKLNGTYTSERRDLLEDVLRGDWGFDGLVMTDWFGGRDAVAQMKAGNDLLMPGTARQHETLMAALESGDLSGSTLDANLERILEVVTRSPAFAGYEYSDAPDLRADAQLGREAAAEGMVLLRNEASALPLEVARKVALFGNASYEMVTGGTGSGDVNEAYSVSLQEGLTGAGFAVDAALAERYAGYIEEQKANQPPRRRFRPAPPIPERPLTPEEIAPLAESSDVALFTLGRNSGEFEDRKPENDFYLSDTEQAAIRDVAAAFHDRGKPVVVVLNIGGVIETPSWRDQVDAILLAWQPGQESGNAIADVLSGKVTPSGKLATTFAADLESYPASSGFPGTVLEGPDPEASGVFARADRAAEVVYTDGIWVGYRFFQTAGVEAAYPFGFGLSYTTFEYGEVSLSVPTFTDKLTVSINVRNIGQRPGREVVQLYVSAPGAGASKPSRELRAFGKTRTLPPGESETLSFTLHPRDLASFDASSSAWVADAGTYTVEAGASAADIRRSATFEKAERETVETVSRSLAPQRSIEEITISD